ncbi:hypothetical protein SCOCK_160211 [Actinacidiphila cocklensis]|uniref:Uncharacterized protein n=1 Tax=Actinacidiphila cocklensis TaxID=887465 RepID=A0A9W4GQ92_9ACTN|nr:hypothetical protein SCOCK_160211 [Actinacidiphila cocklensis]
MSVIPPPALSVPYTPGGYMLPNR